METQPETVAAPVATQPIHPSIVAAVCKIMTTVSAVKKSQRNQHGGYNYASTDDIYAAITHKMGEVGLILITREDACEIVRVEKEGKTAQWARITFSFVLATAEGTWSDPCARRTLYIQVTGAQTFQAAQSYAEKSFLRSLLKIPTGDMDLDGMPQGDDEETQLALVGNGTKRKSSSAAKKDGTDKLFNELRGAIQAATGQRAALIELRQSFSAQWAALPERWSSLLDDEYEDAINSCRDAAE